MKKIIHKVKQQPIHVRETIVWVSAVIVFLFVGIIWFVDFQEDTYALLNPKEVQEQDTVVAENEKTSPFSALLSSMGDLKAQISDFFSKIKDKESETQKERTPQSLPLSD